jgi:hypothetical protein
MARELHKLSARAAEMLSKPGRHSDGGGLYLAIGSDGRKRWTFMYTWRRKQREAGLGAAGKGGVSFEGSARKGR